MILGTPQGDVSIARLQQVARPASTYRSSILDSNSAFTGREVTRSAAMGLPAFWSAVMLISKIAGTLPLETLDTNNNDAVVSRAGVAMRMRYAPNSEWTSPAFWVSLFSMFVASHNAYTLNLPPSDGIQADEMFLIPPENVQVYRGPDRELRYDLFTAEGGEWAMGVHGRHITHFKGPTIDGGLIGTSPVSMMKNSLGIGLAAQEYQGAMYRAGGVPKGALSVDEVLTPEQAMTIRDQWHSTYGGIENAGKIAVLDRGASFKPTGMTHDDAQFIEQLQLSATDCARMFNLPPALIGAEGASLTYANAQHNDHHFLMFTLRPYLDFIEATLNNDPTFYGVFSPWVPRFNTDELQRPVQGERYANYAAGIAAGWLDVDEVRASEGLPLRVAAPLGADGGATDGATASIGDVSNG